MKIYFKSLENADIQTVERISQNYPALSRSERSEIYRKIRARRSTASEFVGEEQVQGVERYRRPMWHAPLRITAAALALTLGLGGTVYAIHGFGRAVPPAASDPDPQSETIAAEPSAEEITEPAPTEETEHAPAEEITESAPAEDTEDSPAEETEYAPAKEIADEEPKTPTATDTPKKPKVLEKWGAWMKNLLLEEP